MSEELLPDHVRREVATLTYQAARRLQRAIDKLNEHDISVPKSMETSMFLAQGCSKEFSKPSDALRGDKSPAVDG